MNGYIKAITGAVPHTMKVVDITLDGRNLIITGGNGSGKTSLLEKIKQRFVGFEHGGKYGKLGGFNIEIPDYADFSLALIGKKAIIRYFKANRQATIAESKGPVSVINNKATHNVKFGKNLEQHLVNLRARRSFAVTESKDEKLVKDITKWFEIFEQNLKIIMEDDSTRITFNPDNFKFSIEQDGTPHYTFQTLSSGYSAIFDVFAELLMIAEVFGISPSDLRGVALIDEIDAHLHVSLQRKILPFLCNSFKKIQFIVTTHSPFIITSVHDAVIYDMTRQEQMDGDLSMYSYETIVEGLLGVPPVSQELQNTITELANLNSIDPPDIAAINTLVNQLKPHQEHLDEESQMFYQMAINKILMSKLKG